MKVYFDHINGRLLLVGEKSTSKYWETHWDDEVLDESIHSEENNKFIYKILKKYVPDKTNRILEGGCGIGAKVYCIYKYGYNIIGIDYAKETVKKVNEIMPEIDVRYGDVRKLPFPENYFFAYWSLGVIEHFWEGYDSIIKEMKRVITPGGYLFLSFPYFSPIRNLKAKLKLYNEYNNFSEPLNNFYQFMLNKKRVIEDLQLMDFKLIKKEYQSGIKGLKDEIFFLKRYLKPVLKFLFEYSGGNKLVQGIIFLLELTLPKLGFGHKVFLVFKNTN